MKYRIHFRKEPNNNILETIELVSDNGDISPVRPALLVPCNRDDTNRPLCLQLLNGYTADDFNSNLKGYTGPYQKLFAEFLQQPLMKQYAKDVVDLRDALCEKNQLDRLTRKCKDLVDNLAIENAICEWISSSEWKRTIERYGLERESLLSELLARSLQFATAVRKYLYMLPLERYGDDSITKAYALSQSYGTLSHLWTFAKHYINRDISTSPRFTQMAEIFLDRYMNINVHKMRINPIVDEIDYWSRILADRSNEYPIFDDTVKCEVLQPYAAQINYWSERKKDKIGAARTLQLCCNYYEEILNLHFLDDHGATALSKLNILLPPNATYGGSSDNQESENLYVSRYGNIAWVSSVVDELDILTRKIEDDDYFMCEDIIELCGLSLYCVIKHNLPVAVCSACGRYYVPRQDRNKNRSSSRVANYCYYSSPHNPKYSCSEYHSHFKSEYVGTSAYEAVKQKVKSLRANISQYDFHIPNAGDNDSIYKFEDFMIEAIKTIYKHAKTTDTSNVNPNTAMILQEDREALDTLSDILAYLKKRKKNWKLKNDEQQIMQNNICAMRELVIAAMADSSVYDPVQLIRLIRRLGGIIDYRKSEKVQDMER